MSTKKVFGYVLLFSILILLTASRFTPSGNIDLRGRYHIFDVLNISAQRYCANDSGACFNISDFLASGVGDITSVVAGAGITGGGTTGDVTLDLNMDQIGLNTTSPVTFLTIDTGQGAYEIYFMDQDIGTTNATTFATVDTGQGAYEVYFMNQDTGTNNVTTFTNITATINITAEGYLLETDPVLHRIRDNATCTIISGDTSIINVC